MLGSSYLFLHKDIKNGRKFNLPETDVMGKKVYFYLYKKNFFLYKNIKKTLTNYNRGLLYSSNPYKMGWAPQLRDIISKHKVKYSIRNNLSFRVFKFYRIKKLFKNLNKENRLYLNKLTGLGLTDRTLTKLFNKTKNIKKLDVINIFFNKKEKVNKKNILYKKKNVKVLGDIVSYSIFKKKIRLLHTRKVTKQAHPTFKKQEGLSVGDGNYTYSDVRQSIAIYHVNEKSEMLIGCEKNINIFSYRTYNWRIL